MVEQNVVSTPEESATNPILSVVTAESILQGLGASNEDLKAILAAGGYSAILADPDQQLALQEPLDRIALARIEEIKQSLGKLGWSLGRYGQELTKSIGDVVYRIIADTKEVGDWGNTVSVSWRIDEVSDPMPDRLQEQNDALAARLNEQVEKLALDSKANANEARNLEDSQLSSTADDFRKGALTSSAAEEARTRESGIALIEGIANELGGTFSEWRQSGSMWQYADLTAQGAVMSIGVSDGGVVQVNKDPFTAAPERAMHITREAVLKTVLHTIEKHQIQVRKDAELEPKAASAPDDLQGKIERLSVLSGKTVEQTQLALDKAMLRMSKEESIALLDKTLADYESRNKNKVSEVNIENLDLTTVAGITRALQLQLALDIRKKGAKYDEELLQKGHISREQAELDAKRRDQDYQFEIRKAPYDSQIEMAEAILAKDPISLIQKFVYGSFESSEKIFARATGVRVKGLSVKQKTATLFAWAEWTQERIAAFENEATARRDAASAARELKEKERILSNAISQSERKFYRQVDGSAISAKALIDEYISKGFRKLLEVKRGAVKSWKLANEESGMSLRLKYAFEGAYATHALSKIPSCAPVLPVDLATSLAESIDDELKTIYKATTGKDPVFEEVFEWVSSQSFDMPSVASSRLLEVAVKRGYKVPARFIEPACSQVFSTDMDNDSSPATALNEIAVPAKRIPENIPGL